MVDFNQTSKIIPVHPKGLPKGYFIEFWSSEGKNEITYLVDAKFLDNLVNQIKNARED